ncbi:MAG: DNA translocase FtsK [Rhizobiales bacterium]|nr:DNA translocase FtsK [Hyphomicrobiales bacterium]
MPDIGRPEVMLADPLRAPDSDVSPESVPLDIALAEAALADIASLSTAPVRVSLPDDLGEDEVFIDWTGGSWAARQAASRPPEPEAEEPVLVEAADVAPEASAVEDVTAAAIEAEASAEPMQDESAPADPAPAADAEPVAEAASVPPRLLRLAGLIVIDPTLSPRAEPDQDLSPLAAASDPVAAAEEAAEEAAEVLAVADAEETSAEPVADEAPFADSSEEEAPQIESLAEDDVLPDAVSVEPAPLEAEAEIEIETDVAVAAADESVDAVAETPVAMEALAVAPAASVSTSPEPMPAYFGWGMTIGAALGWPASPAVTAPPAVPEAPAPQAVAPAMPEAAAQGPAAPAVSEALGYPPLPPDAPYGAYELPPLDLLTEPPEMEPDFALSEEALDRNSAVLQQTLRDFGVRGEVIDANPGPVVTLYEFEPAPGTKSSRVIGLSADIARSMSAVSTRVAVVEGRNVIGIELPNARRDTVWLRELLADQSFADARGRLGIALGKTIGGEPVIADLARMPHLLVAGTTGSGKSVAINTMILSLLYRLTPEQCRLIMIDPKMLELSVYEGIPHLLTPVVTDPKKAIIALQWAVREMEDRYRKMARLKVRNIEGFNARVAEAREKGEVITFTVDKGFDKETGETLVEEATLDLTALPYIVIIVDEMADLMMVAGKDIEGAIQRLAQMARAAGIHLVMATQRPSVDVITGTIKANFPTRISFQVTSKIDSRTILGEMGAETLLGQGDMLYMANGGRITRVHGPFVSDGEVEHVVAHLKAQGRPEYLDAVTAADEEEEADEDGAVFDRTALGEDGADHYEQAVALVLRDRKASTSYIQRRLQIGYNKAASLMERMEQEGIVGPANHAGKREILAAARPA